MIKLGLPENVPVPVADIAGINVSAKADLERPSARANPANATARAEKRRRFALVVTVPKARRITGRATSDGGRVMTYDLRQDLSSVEHRKTPRLGGDRSLREGVSHNHSG